MFIHRDSINWRKIKTESFQVTNLTATLVEDPDNKKKIVFQTCQILRFGSLPYIDHVQISR